MYHAERLFRIVVACNLAVATLSGCATQEKRVSSNDHADTTVKVYGPYRAVKLPLSKGVKMGNPIQLALGPGGLLFAANQTGEVYTLRDSDGDGLEDSTALFCNVEDYGLRSPAGFAHKGDTVFIGTAQQVRAFVDVDKDGKADTSWSFFDHIPQSEHPYEWTSGLSFGPDGWLYCAITTDSWNAAPAADPGGFRGAIIRISPDGRKSERIATGIRSVPGMAFNRDGDLFFLDNEGGGNPTEELNRLVVNAFYGHNKRKYPADSSRVLPPEFELQSEVAPSSLEFSKTQQDLLFVSYYGPGERWTRGGVGRISVKKQPNGTYAYQEYTIADVPKLSDLAFGKDGDLYLAHHGMADYWYNAVYNEQGGFYKLVYDQTVDIPVKNVRTREAVTFSENGLEMGKQLFADLGCLGCHQVDGTTELLGPNLKDVAKNYSREEILEEILQPSARIKPSMGGVKITKTDGTILLGRVVNATDKELSFMLVGNKVVTVLRTDISTMADEKKSLMFEGLTNGLPEEQREALLDYLVSLSQ